MSRTSILYFEYKRKGTSEWKLFAPLVKKSELYLDYHYNLVDTPININGEEYIHSFQDDIQGTIRDYLNDSHQEFNDRGFPKDMSSELAMYLERQEKNDDLFGTWGHSWVNLDEFIKAIEKDIAYNKEKIDEYTSKSEFERVHDKLDIILKKLNNETIITKTKQDDPDSYYDYLEYIAEYKEELECLEYAKQYLEGVELMISIINNAWVDTYDIRIVYFTC